MRNLLRAGRRWLGRCIYRQLFSDIVEERIESHLVAEPHFFGGGRECVKIASSASVLNAFFNLSSGKVLIEDDVMFGNNVSLLTGRHDPDCTGKARHAWPREGGDIIVKRGAWVASHAVVLGPCVIGEHAVVAAGAVVTKDVESYTLVAGVPAKVIRNIGKDALTEGGAERVTVSGGSEND